MAGMMTYQSAAGQWERFGRRPAGRPALHSEFGGRFEIESYLHYQGRELTGRFDANSYLYLSRAMDLYDLASGYESDKEAYSRIQAEVLFVGITSDWLFPAAEVRSAKEKARKAGTRSDSADMDSVCGLDAFLMAWKDLSQAIVPFLSF
jgi:homoserine O-acetyltransferase